MVGWLKDAPGSLTAGLVGMTVVLCVAVLLTLTLPGLIRAERAGRAVPLAGEGAATCRDGIERRLRRDGDEDSVAVPLSFALGRGLDLEQVGRMQPQTVRTHAARAERIIVGGHGLHLGHHAGATLLSCRDT